MKYICTILSFIVLGCAATSTTSEAPGSGACVQPALTTADIQISGFPAEGWGGNGVQAAGSLVRAGTAGCAFDWLRVIAGPLRFSILHEGKLPATVDAASQPPSGACSPPQPEQFVSAPGFKTVAGTVTVSYVSVAGAKAKLTFSSNDLVIVNTTTQAQSTVAFNISTTVGQHCVTLQSGQAFGSSTWAIRQVGHNANGDLLCGTQTATWTGVLNPLSPPVLCEVADGKNTAVTPATGADAQ